MKTIRMLYCVVLGGILLFSACANSIERIDQSVSATLADIQTATAVVKIQMTSFGLETTIAGLQATIDACNCGACQNCESSAGGDEYVYKSQSAVVKKDFLCFAGPGDSYGVVFSVKKGIQVEVNGRGVSQDWLVILVPGQNFPCWAQEKYLQFDFDPSGLDILTPIPIVVQPTSEPNREPPPISYP